MKSQNTLVSKVPFCLMLLLPVLLFWSSGRSISAENRIIAPHSVNMVPQSSNQVCGTISAYTPATIDQPGALTIGGMGFTIAKGVSLQGVTVGSNVCLNLCL